MGGPSTPATNNFSNLQIDTETLKTITNVLTLGADVPGPSNVTNLSNLNPNSSEPRSFFQDPTDDDRLKETLLELYDKAHEAKNKTGTSAGLENQDEYTSSSEVGLYSQNTGRRFYTGPTIPRKDDESLEDFKGRTGQNSGQSPRSSYGRPLTPSRAHYPEETPTSGAAKQNPFGN